jgi:hypothetical protein
MSERDALRYHNGSKQERVVKIPAVVGEHIGIDISRWVELEIIAEDLTRAALPIPLPSNAPEFFIVLRPHNPYSASLLSS